MSSDQPRKPDPTGSASTGSVLQGFRSGDSRAVDEVEERVRRIVSYRGYGIPIEQQEELCQDALIQIWQAVNKDGFDAERGFWGFVQVVSARRCIDWRRKKREARSEAGISLLPDPRRGPFRRLVAGERDKAVRGVLDELGAACRQVIDLRVAGDKSYSEIAEITGRSEQALRAQMYRCIKKARQIIGESRRFEQ